MKNWPTVKFEAFLRHRKEFFRIDDLTEYKRARVQLHWKGIVLRDSVLGAEIKTKEQQTARARELLVAEIDAKVGGVGIVPSDLDGAVVSSHYFLFQIDETRCLGRWLDNFIRSGALEDQLVARGSTNYAAIRPQHVLTCEIPLPPIDEQRRIVGRIEELSAKVEEARLLRTQSKEHTRSILGGTLHRLFVEKENSWTTSYIGEAAEIVDPNPSHRMPHYTTADFGVPFISTVDFEGAESIRRQTAKYITRDTYHEQVERCNFSVGDILYTRIGTIGEARLLAEVWPFGLSHVLVVVKPNRDVIEPRFLLWYLRSDSISTQASAGTRSVGVPDLGIKRIRQFHMPLPSLLEQRRVVDYLDGIQARVENLKKLQLETSKELDALMPSILSKAFSGEL